MTKLFSPNTMEHINTTDPQPWMGVADVEAPSYDATTQGCFWDPEAKNWNVVEVVPEKDVPEKVTRFQAKAVLLQAGYLETLEQFVNSDQAPAMVKLAYNEALHFERQSEFVASLAPILGLTDDQIDDLFIAAAKIL